MILIEKASIDYGPQIWSTYRFLKDECYERVIDMRTGFNGNGWELAFFSELESIFHTGSYTDDGHLSDRVYDGKMICD